MLLYTACPTNLCSQQVLTLVNPFTKLLFTCKALLHTLVKYCFVELILQDYFFLYLSFFLQLISMYNKKCRIGQMKKNQET